MPWDGKAVGVAAVAGEYVEIAKMKYWYSRISGYGLKAAKECPWYAALTGATLYDISIGRRDIKPIAIKDRDYVEIEYSSEAEAFFKKILGTKPLTTQGKLKIPVASEVWKLYAEFNFYYGQTGIFGGCPNLNFDHMDYVNEKAIIAIIP